LLFPVKRQRTRHVELISDMAVAGAYLKQTINLPFFDSHCVAVALNLDGRIISFDQWNPTEPLS